MLSHPGVSNATLTVPEDFGACVISATDSSDSEDDDSDISESSSVTNAGDATPGLCHVWCLAFGHLISILLKWHIIIRLSSSGAVSQRPRCLCRWHSDNDDSHHSRTVVMLQRTKTDKINHAVSVFTCAKCSGSQPVGLLQRCRRLSSSLRHPATTVSAQHSCTFGGRFIAT